MKQNEHFPKWKIWLLAARPKTLWAGIVPVVIGTSLAFDTNIFNLFPFFAALIGSILIQIGANLANDYFDFLKEADTEERLGPLRVTQAGLVSLKEIKIATILVFLLASFVGIYLVFRGGIPILIIGLTSLLFAVVYTGGTFPLGYKGLGDIFVLIYYGPVAVAGTFYIITLDLNLMSILAGIPAGMISTAILTVNNLRDIESDRKSGKKTLAVRFGQTFAQFEFLFMVGVGILFPLVIFVFDRSHPWTLIACLSIFLALPTIKKVFTQTGRDLNPVLSQTGKILALYGLLFSIGYLI